jgi:hypothetical protein
MAGGRRLERLLKVREAVWRRRAEDWAAREAEAAGLVQALTRGAAPRQPGAMGLWAAAEPARAERLAEALLRRREALRGMAAAGHRLAQAVVRRKAAERLADRRAAEAAVGVDADYVTDVEAWHAAGLALARRRRRA